MRRALVSLVALLCVIAVASGGTYSAFSTTQTNSATTATASTFVPVNQGAPSITGTVALSSTLNLVRGTWGYNAASGGTVDSTARQAITRSDQWQYCISSTCTDLSGQTGTTLTIDASIVTAIGGLGLSTPSLSFRVSESASNASGTAAAVVSNALS